MHTATPTGLQPGQTIGGYTIESVIASGGMGTVYRARRAMLDKTVALKVLHPSFAPEKDHLQRFLREAKVAANLDHPAVIKVFDVGNDGGLYFMAMEFVDGRDLKSLVTDNGPFSPRKALRIARQIAEVLAYAHDKGLIHRDVKPANILITEKNEIKLADFGLARLCREDHEVTMAGTILGTPAFMSPEQCRGDALDGRTDLYSLGATLYYLLSGKLPFAGDNPSVLIHRVVNELPPPLQTLVRGIPDNVVELVQRLMAKLPSARFADGYEVTAAIDEVMVGRSVASIAARGKVTAVEEFTVPWVTIGILAIVVVLFAMGLYFSAGISEAMSAESARKRPHALTSVHSAAGKAAPATPANPADAPSFDAEFEELQKEAATFVEHLSTGAWNKIDGYLDAGLGVSIDRRREVKDLIDTIVARRMESVKYRTQQKSPGWAWTVVVFSRPQSGESLTYTIVWTRKEGAWYVERIEKGEIR